VDERRKSARVKTDNLISHVTIDEAGRWTSQGMGRALDISRTGMMLETACPLESGHLSIMTVDVNNKLIEIQGELIYCRKSDTAMYHSGVNFIGTNDQITKFVTQLIKVYFRQKNKLYIVGSKRRQVDQMPSG
jgi:hypothetical protein